MRRLRISSVKLWKVSKLVLRKLKLIWCAGAEGFFDGYISKQPVKAKWTLIPYLKDDDDVTSVPSTSLDMRGGHQMCIDSEAGKMYLYGGWDGSKELGDLWQFSNKDHTWKCLSPNTLQEVS